MTCAERNRGKDADDAAVAKTPQAAPKSTSIVDVKA